MDRIPNEVLARIFSHIPNLAQGRIMSVSRSWNTLLSTSPKLWINVHLLGVWNGIISVEKVLQIVEVFSNRSQSTLETIILPFSPLNNLEIAKMIQLLESSRATLRKLVFWPEEYIRPMEDLMDFVGECAQLEELDLTGQNRGDKRVEPSPGTLTYFSCFDVVIVPERNHQLLRNLKVLQVMESAGPLLLKVLSRCSGTLQHFTLQGHLSSQSMQKEIQDIVSNSLHQLKSLCIDESCVIWSKEWDLSALHNLEELGINPEYYSSLGPFRTPIRLNLSISTFEDDGEDDRLELLQRIIEVLDSCQASIRVLTLSNSWGEPAKRSIDQVLEFLRVNIVLGAPCLNLQELHLSKDIDFSATLLAEVLLSRRLLSKGYSILSPEGNEDDVHRCSELILFLDSENQEGFKEAERVVLSRCSEWMREAAGKATLRTRSLSD